MIKKLTVLLIIVIALTAFAIKIVPTYYGVSKNHGTTTSNHQKNEEKKEVKIKKITIETLHQSNVKPPSKTELINAQNIIDSEIEKKDLDTVKTGIHEMHMMFETGFVYQTGNWIEHFSDPRSPYWIYWEKTGPIKLPGETEVVNNDIDARTYIQQAESIKNKVNNEDFKTDMDVIERLIGHAKDKHDIMGLVYTHQVLHDLDYWLLNYPIYFPTGKGAPPDWEGVNTYFGASVTLKGANLPGLLQD